MSAGIVAFAFGEPSSISSNRLIASFVAQNAKSLNAPIFTQVDIDLRTYKVEVSYIPQESDKPPPTLRIATEAIKWADEKGITELWVIAALPHITRCVRDLKYAIQKAQSRIELYTCSKIYRYPQSTWFCQDSTQERTRSPKAWSKREWILLHLPMFLYRIATCGFRARPKI